MKRDIIVFDFETGGRNKLTCQPTQIAAIALDGRNFKPKGEFVSYMRPIIDDDEAIAAGEQQGEGLAGLQIAFHHRARLLRGQLQLNVLFEVAGGEEENGCAQ